MFTKKFWRSYGQVHCLRGMVIMYHKHPDAYRRVIRPASAVSRQAREMKTTMRAWLSHTKKTFRSIKDWEAEWKVGTRLATKEADITETGASVMLP